MLDPAPIKARYIDLFGHGWQTLLAEALDIHRVTMSRQWNGVQPLDPSVLSSLEWLEVTPIEDWPPRWAKLAELHRAKMRKERA